MWAVLEGTMCIAALVLAGGDSGAEPVTLTLEQAVQMALERNPQVAISRRELEKAEAGVWEAVGALLPSVGASAAAQHAWDLQSTTIPNFIKPMLEPLAPYIPGLEEMPDYVEMTFGMENVVRYGLTVRQPLFLGGAGIAGVRLATAVRHAMREQEESVRQRLISQTARAFYSCLLAREVVRVEEQAVAHAEANLATVKARYEAGSASGFDLMRAEVEVANLRPHLIASRNGYRASLANLKAVLGLPHDREVEPLGSLDYQPDDLAQQPLGALVEAALVRRPEMRMLTAQKRAASSAVAIARSAFLPKLFFSTEYSYQGMRNDWDFRRGDFSKGFTSAVSAQLSLFEGFRNLQGYHKARVDLRIVEQRQREMESAIAAEVEVARNSFVQAQEKLDSARETIGLAREALRLADLRYQEGVSTQLDVLGAQLALRQAELNYVSALFEYQMARYELRRVTGTLQGAL